MLQLIKADLTSALALFAEYRPQLDRRNLALDLKMLERAEDRDYLFLARREKCWLFPISQVYRAESYAYLCWTAYTILKSVPVDALYLHVSRVVHGYPIGTVTLLDYETTVRDVLQFAAPSEQECAAHIRQITEHYRCHAKIGSTMDFISAVKNVVEFYS